MALTELKTTSTNSWRLKFSLDMNANTSHQLPIIVGKQTISYSALKQLCSIEGLGNRRSNSSREAHDAFMKNYSKILKPSDEKLPPLDLKLHTVLNGNGKLDYSSNNGTETALIPHGHRPAHYCSSYNYSISHNIRDHLALLHKQHVTQTKDGVLKAKSYSLKKLLRKLPFERTRSDQDAIFQHLQYFTTLTSQVPLKILRELSTVILLEKWNNSGYTVFSKNELYLIIKGSVAPCNEKYLRITRKSSIENFPPERKASDEDVDSEKLVAGQCFGALHQPESGYSIDDCNTRISSVITLEPCEFVKISARDFNKMKQLVDSKVTNQKLELMQSCRLFEKCSKVALGKVVDLIKWKTFRPGTVLVNEGESCRVIGFINEGTCNMKRCVDVAKTNRDGTKDRRQKQVVVGKLGPGDSFGECTVLREQPIAYSVVTASYVQLGVISQRDFNGVDEVTKSLLSQCYEAIEQQYVRGGSPEAIY